jgi:hypothetical protein
LQLTERDAAILRVREVEQSGDDDPIRPEAKEAGRPRLAHLIDDQDARCS